MADTSLIFSIIARDKTSSVLLRIKATAASTGSIIAKSLGPAILPAVGVASAGILGVGAALGAAGVAAGVFGGVATAAMKEVTESATKFTDLQDKIALLNKQAELAPNAEAAAGYLDKAAKAQLELNARIALLPAHQQKAVRGYLNMKGNWQDFVDSNKPATFGVLAKGYELISSSVLKLQPLFDIGRAAASRMIATLQGWVDGGGLARMAKIAGPAMSSLISIIQNVGSALGGMMGKFSGQGQGILSTIEGWTAKWAEWSKATETGTGVNKFVEYVATNGPQVISVLTQIGTAAVHIAQAVSPLAPVSLAVAGALAAIIAAVPPGVIQAMVVAWVAWNVALKAWAIGQAIATAAQWAHNAAMLASPTTWIILAIVALVAVIVLVATKTRFFQTIWEAVWGFMKKVGAWFAGPFAGFFVALWNKIVASLQRAKGQFMSVINFIKGLAMTWFNAYKWAFDKLIAGWNKLVSKLKSGASSIKNAVGGMFSGLWNGFRAGINKVIGGWNRLSFTIPSVTIFGKTMGGGTIAPPRVPYLAKGTDFVQSSGLAMIHRGETVRPAKVSSRFTGGKSGEGGTLTLRSDGSRLSNLLLEVLREAIRDQGGNPVKVLTAK